MMKEIKSLGKFPSEALYEINGVKYIVSSKFSTLESILKIENTIKDKVKKYVGSDFADLNVENDNDILENDVMNTTARKEDYAV